jgi:carbamate kinase
MAGIGRLEDAVAILAGTAGTILTPTGDYSPSGISPRID